MLGTSCVPFLGRVCVKVSWAVNLEWLFVWKLFKKKSAIFWFGLLFFQIPKTTISQFQIKASKHVFKMAIKLCLSSLFLFSFWSAVQEFVGHFPKFWPWYFQWKMQTSQQCKMGQWKTKRLPAGITLKVFQTKNIEIKFILSWIKVFKESPPLSKNHLSRTEKQDFI